MKTQCGAEFYAIDKFFKIIARNGVRVPEDSYLLREELDDWGARFQSTEPVKDRVWPSAQLYSLIALAQHHGVPTRALDWTWSAYTAAYFAARPALTKEFDGSYLAVWAIDDFTRRLDRILDVGATRPLRVFTVSGTDNANLRAQQGLFMLHPQQLDGSSQTFAPVDYAQLLEDSLVVLKKSQLIRVLIARNDARNVLALLARAGVTAGGLHPDLSGAAREYEDDQLIRPDELSTLYNRNTVGLWDEIQKAAKSSGA